MGGMMAGLFKKEAASRTGGLMGGDKAASQAGTAVTSGTEATAATSTESKPLLDTSNVGTSNDLSAPSGFRQTTGWDKFKKGAGGLAQGASKMAQSGGQPVGSANYTANLQQVSDPGAQQGQTYKELMEYLKTQGQ